MPPKQNITVSEERLNLALAVFELKIVERIQLSEGKMLLRLEEVKTAIAGNPETIAGMKAMIADNTEDIEDLQKSDKRWTTIAVLASSLVSGLISGISALWGGQNK